MVRVRKIVPHFSIKRNPLSRLSRKSGLPPGTLLHIGDDPTEPVTVTYVRYDQESFSMQKNADLSKVDIGDGKYPVHWINVDGLSDPDVIQEVGAKFGLHHLLLEDVMNTEHIPKVEEFDQYIFFTLKALHFNEVSLELATEQVSFVLGSNYVISFQERPENVYQGILGRMEEGKYKNKEADYLVYRLIDVIVDSYFHVLESLEDNIDISEDEVFKSPVPEHLQSIQSMKRVLLVLRKSIYPLREAINQMQKRDSAFISQDIIKYFKDLYDHTVHIYEGIENARDINAGLKDIYLSSLSNKMNRVMQVLTIISTIFIPLSFVVGVYGMNFDNMPELHWQNGYYYIWAGMILLVTIQLVLFRRKGWLG